MLNFVKMKDQLIRSPLEKRLKAWHGEEWHTAKGRIIRDIVYAIDTGLVTTVAFLAGVSVSFVTKNKVIIAGLIQIVAGTLAIFFASYVSSKAQKHFFENQIEREKKEIEEDPLKEAQEIRDIFSDMGFIQEEQEIALISAGSFLVGAIPALLPFFIFDEVAMALAASVTTTVIFLFVLGVTKSKITKMHWLRSGVETLSIGALSCGSGFLLGRIIASYFH